MLVLLEEFCRANAISEDDMFNVRLVLDEAVINVFTHGYEDMKAHQVDVSLALHQDVLTIHIEDDGIAYNPLDAPAPRFDLPIEERRIGGLGVHIMKTLARSLDYSRGQDRNHLTIEMTIGRENGTASPA